MTIIFPMAGLSSRFTKAGYLKPKYMLTIDNKSVFYHAVNSFKNYFNDANILFIFRNIHNTKEFIVEECGKLNLIKYELIELHEETNGQAESVAIGLEKAHTRDEEKIVIFNIDTFRPDFIFPKELDLDNIDGYLEVFEGSGDNWSFVLPESKLSNKVIKTAEKERISSLCSSGLYYFKKMIDFKNIFYEMLSNNERSKNEFYIAPMYNHMIKTGKDIRYSKIEISNIVFCGTPDEYEKLKNNSNNNKSNYY